MRHVLLPLRDCSTQKRSTRAKSPAHYSSMGTRRPRRRLRLRALGRHRAHEIHQVPAQFLGLPVPFSHHLSLAFGNDVKDLAVGLALESRGIVPVAHRQFHRFHDFAFAVTMFTVAHGAVIFKDASRLRQSFGRRLQRIFSRDVFWSDFVVINRRLSRTRTLLCRIARRGRHTETNQQKRTRNGERAPHTYLLVERIRRRTTTTTS